jgi:hypothetical protein
MADRALNNSAPAMVQTGRKFKRVREFFLEATFDSGTATVVDAGTDDGVSIVKDATGDYDVTFPQGVRFLGGWANLDPGDDTPADTDPAKVQLMAFNAGAGTGKLIVTANSDGNQEDPLDTATLYCHFYIQA